MTEGKGNAEKNSVHSSFSPFCTVQKMKPEFPEVKRVKIRLRYD
jgi:hypothetical protein